MVFFFCGGVVLYIHCSHLQSYDLKTLYPFKEKKKVVRTYHIIKAIVVHAFKWARTLITHHKTHIQSCLDSVLVQLQPKLKSLRLKRLSLYTFIKRLFYLATYFNSNVKNMTCNLFRKQIEPKYKGPNEAINSTIETKQQRDYSIC